MKMKRDRNQETDLSENSTPWKKGKTLGNGSYGTVYSTNYSSAAVKSAYSGNYLSLERESRFLKELRGNPFVVECFGEDISQEEEGGEWFYNVIMELAPRGTLDDIILGYGKQIMPESQVAYYSYLLLRGLSEIHRRGIIHCDIKPNNILVFKNRHGLDHLKLADFGLAKFEWDEDDDSEEVRGALKYAAPESVSRGAYSKATDVWSFGMTVLKMFAGRSIWGRGMEKSDLMDLIVMKGAPETPDYVSEKGKDFLKKCLNREADGRWTAEKLVNHPFIRDSIHENLEEWMISPPGFESRDVVGMKNPFGCWSSTRGLFFTPRPVCSDQQLSDIQNKIFTRRWSRIFA